ncbi:MAG: PilZ domain-containing protein [Alteraurantiacibacter sp.]
MKDVETRQVNRDSLFLLAQLRLDGTSDVFRVKVRNLSAGGMMAEGLAPVTRGQPVAVELRNIGWVNGSVAWKQDDRFGIAFLEEIDPRLARAPATQSAATPLSAAHRSPLPAQAPAPEKLRKL